MPSGYQKNPKLAQELVDERAYVKTLFEKAEEAVTAAKSFAPVRTGRYRDGIKVVVRGKKVYAAAQDFKSHWIEWGSVHQSPQAPLRRGARAVGLRLDEREKPR